MDSCKYISIKNSLDDVSKECKKSAFCKSKVNEENYFFVESIDVPSRCTGKDPRTVWIKSSTDGEKISKLDDLLLESGFFDVVNEKCRRVGKDCKIKIKPNIASATQKGYKYYTDPEIVNHVADRLKEKGYNNVEIVESATRYSFAFPTNVPDKVAKKLGYNHPVINLSSDEQLTIPYKNGSIRVSKRMVDADMIINIPKVKNHQIQLVTGALKNMYGSLWSEDKYALYHHQESGLNVEESTIAVNNSTPSDFIIADMIHSIDGNEEPVHFYKKDDHFNSNLLMASQDPLSLDKVAEAKMGYKENESTIIKEYDKFRGNIDKNEIPLEGGDLSKIEGWKKVSPFHRRNVLIRDSFTKLMRSIGLGGLIPPLMRIFYYDIH